MEIQAASQGEKAALGQGYDVEREEFVGQCVRGEVEFAGGQESHLSFDRSLDESRTASELGFQVGVRVRYGLFSGGLAAKFASESSASDYSDVTVYSHTINFKNAKFRFPGIEQGLTPEGKSAKGNPEGNLVGKQWPITCGHEYVSQIVLGAKLLVSVKVEFATREDKRSFSASVDFQGPPVKVEAAINAASEKFGKRASLSIQAYQLGGDVRRLSEIFRTPEGSFPILEASLDNPSALLEALRAAVKYGTEEFSKQIDPNIPLGSPIGPAELFYITSPWAELGLFAPEPELEAGVTEARRLLSAEFEKNVRYQRRLTRILSQMIRLSPRQLDHFKEMQRVVSRNHALIHEAHLVCYKDFLQAPTKVAQVVEQLLDFTPEAFDVQPESFAQWWDMKDLPDTLKRDKRVVEEIADIFIPQFNNFEQIEDKGLALQKQLASLEKFSIQPGRAHWFDSPVWSIMADSNIVDFFIADEVQSLAPVRWLARLKQFSTLVPVTDLASIASLLDLSVLKVEGPISSLAPVAGLQKLVRLQVRNNKGRIRDLSPLANLSDLRELAVDEGAIEDVSPLVGLSELISVSLGLNPIRSIAPLLALPKLNSLFFGSTDASVADTKLLNQLPRFANFFVVEERIAISETSEDGGRNAVWTRRGETNLFDTVTTNAATGAQVAGMGAFTGVVARAQGVGVQLLHQRAGKLLMYVGDTTFDRQHLQSGVFFEIPIASDGQWTAQKA